MKINEVVFLLSVLHIRKETMYFAFLKFCVWIRSEFWSVYEYLMEFLNKTIENNCRGRRRGRNERKERKMGRGKTPRKQGQKEKMNK